jgi:hypothetical protein
MWALRPRNWACDRARQAASVRLDRELSELETALLEAHLARCSACAEFAADVEAVTLALRVAPLERLERPIELPLRRRVAFGARRATGLVAAVTAAAAALLAVTVLPNQRVETGPPTPVVVPSNNEDLRDLRILHRAQMKPIVQVLGRPSRGVET